MTLQELVSELSRSRSLTDFDNFLRSHLYEVRPIFYGLTRAELKTQYLDYEDALLVFQNSQPGREIQRGNEPPPSVVALLVFFFSFFERAGLYTDILHVANLLPAGSLCNRAKAIFEYKYITNAEKDYLERFERIVALVQEAWTATPEDRRAGCADLLIEYALDALLLPLAPGTDLRADVQARFLDPGALSRYPILDQNSIKEIFELDDDALQLEHTAVRSRIAEALHREACELVPASLLLRSADDPDTQEGPAERVHSLPDWLDARLEQMGATYRQRRQAASVNFEASSEDNRIYLGTYFPRTVVEARNVLSELLSIRAIGDAMAGKDIIRVLDIGSGTGAAVVGTLLALLDWGRCEAPVEVTAMDTNLDALAKQSEILETVRQYLPFELIVLPRYEPLPFDLEGFVSRFSEIAVEKSNKYDLILSWKCLSEFYNHNFVSAHGIIRTALHLVSRMLVPYGLCIVSDLTTTDNGFEHFSMTLNREANEHDAASDAVMRTVLPLPCGRFGASCPRVPCYTQRKFTLHHRLVQRDETKIAYRVFARDSFSRAIVATFTRHQAYRVNAARRAEACFGLGKKREVALACPSGYTGFFA